MGTKMNDEVVKYKKQAAESAVQMVRSGMVVGLGAGSTAILAVHYLAELLAEKKIRDIVGVPCSLETERVARSLGIPLTTLDERQTIDLTIDGADEVDPDLNVIKGGGGALLREKIVAQNSKREIIIVDESKLSPKLGTNWALPVEIVPFGWKTQVAYIAGLGAEVTLRLDDGGNPYRTDQGNHILDCNFGPINDPAALAGQLGQRAGIVEHGLFIGLVTDVIVAGPDGIRHLKKE